MKIGSNLPESRPYVSVFPVPSAECSGLTGTTAESLSEERKLRRPLLSRNISGGAGHSASELRTDHTLPL